MPPPIHEVLQAYAAVWSEANASRREALLSQCWSEAAEIIGPGYYFKGTSAVLAEIERFHKQERGYTVVLTSGFDTHTNWARFTFALIGPDGARVNEGWDLVELAADGRIARVITFWGALPVAPTGDAQGQPASARESDA